jgi:hypothetical protein
MERQEFEKSLRQAFDEAQVRPSDNVWTNIELDLERAQGNRLRKRVLFYQLLAAASVFFAIGISVSVFFFKNSTVATETSGSLAAVNSSNSTLSLPLDSKSQGASSSNVINSARSNDAQNLNSLNNNDIALKPKKFASANITRLTKDENPSTSLQPALERKLLMENAREELNEMIVLNERRTLTPLTEAGTKTLKFVRPGSEIDPVALMLARLDERTKEIQKEGETKKEKKNRSENLWTSVGFAAGSFSPINAGVSNSQSPPTASVSQSNSAYAINSSVANQQARASGITYSMGVNVGTRLSEHWLVQGGVNYLTQSSDYTATYGVFDQNFAKFRPSSISELQKTVTDDTPQGDKIAATAPYNVNNSNRYLSIPMQAGYLLINKSFGWQVNAGVATDLFLQNTLTADVQNPSQTNSNSSENSAYRSINLSGLMGTEVSYKFGQHYRVALNPGLRYPFGNIYKSSSVKANPLTFDVGVRFRYIFH